MWKAALVKRAFIRYNRQVERKESAMRFSFVSKQPDCGIVLYDAVTGKEKKRIPFVEEKRRGNVYIEDVDDVLPEGTSYLFYRGEELVPDCRGRVFPGMRRYGRKKGINAMRAGIPKPGYDWEGDRCPRLPYSQMLVYCMHVRGFTRHASSGVAGKGTFAGIQEKIPYLKEIGVTAVELQPCYEFSEISAGYDKENAAEHTAGEKGARRERLNYWGYVEGFYYAPKSAYAATEDPVVEFKELVKELHRNGMELIMQFYFPQEVNRNEVGEILRFWSEEYHVDGFHLMGVELPVKLLATDDLLADKKLWYYHFDYDEIYGAEESSEFPHLGEYNDSYLYEMRKFLKGDENTLDAALKHMRRLPEKAGRLHYLSNYSGFTLADMVSYDYKHNEQNGEENLDGTDYNCSWNCGEEGGTRSRKIKNLRLRQIRNAMCFLLLSQSTPLIFMGDEFGNSQKGNNNPWCQDNAVTWLDWSLLQKNRELLAFWKSLATFRKEHAILHPNAALRMMDTLSCGYPDLSYHGENAWRPRLESYYRHAGIMLCENYALPADGEGETAENGFIYIALNMHWEGHVLALPRLPKGFGWKQVYDTAKESLGGTDSDDRQPAADMDGTADERAENTRQISPRSVAVYVSVRETAKTMKQKDRKDSVYRQ